MLRKIAPLALALCLSTLAPLAALAQKMDVPVQVVTTDKVDFAPGGTIRFEGGVGELNIEGWDQPQVQVIMTRLDYALSTDKEKMTERLKRITVKAEKGKDNELVITTKLPKRNFFVRKVLGASNGDMDYRVMVPRDSHLVIHHGDGDVVVYDVSGDVEATARVGTVMVQLPDPEQYSIDARSKLGEVYTDYDGNAKRHHLMGHGFVTAGKSPGHRVFARVRIGDIDVIKMGVNPITATK